MKKKLFGFSLIGCCALFVATGAAVVSVHRPTTYELQTTEDRTRILEPWVAGWQARLGEVVLPLLSPGDTEYAPGFSQQAFDRIKIGAREQEVLENLGEPLFRKSFPEPIMKESCPNGCSVWYYARHGPRSKSYFVRAFEFDGEGRLARKFREYGLD